MCIGRQASLAEGVDILNRSCDVWHHLIIALAAKLLNDPNQLYCNFEILDIVTFNKII